MAEVTDLRAVLRRKRRWRRLGQLCLVLLLAFIALVVGSYWEEISHWFAATEAGESLLVSGNGWPASLEGTEPTQAFLSDGRLLVTTDRSVVRFDEKNRYHSIYTHQMASPVSANAGDWTAVWSVGSTAIKLYSPKQQMYAKTTEAPILAAALSKKGQVAVSTLSGRYNTTLYLWDQNGDSLLTYSAKQQVTAISFSPAGDRLALAEVGTKNGALFTKISIINPKEETPVWTKELPDIMPLALRLWSDGSVTLVGDKTVVFLDSQGEELSRDDYLGTLLSYQFHSNRLALTLAPYSNGSSTRLSLYSKEGSSLWSTSIEEEIESITLSDHSLLCVSAKSLFRLEASSGKRLNKQENSLGALYLAELGGEALAVTMDQIVPFQWEGN